MQGTRAQIPLQFMRPCAQAHYSQVSARDAAMSRSLNSDYLGQLLIQVDTGRLDGRLVAAATEGAELPEEARALLVFKRGCARAALPRPSHAQRGAPRVALARPSHAQRSASRSCNRCNKARLLHVSR